MPSSPWKTIAHEKFCRRMLTIPESPFQTQAWTASRARWLVDLDQCRSLTWEDPEEASWPAEARTRRDELVDAFRRKAGNLPPSRKATSRHVVAWNQSLDFMEAEIRSLERQHDPTIPKPIRREVDAYHPLRG